MIINFIGNSIKFQQKGEIYIIKKNYKGYLWFEVQDSGAGVKKEKYF